MKLIVHIPLSVDRIYFEDFDEDSIPNVGDDFDDRYFVYKKEINNNICELTLMKNEESVCFGTKFLKET